MLLLCVILSSVYLVYILRPVYSDATQLDVELSCVCEVSIATPTQLTQLNLT